MQKSEYCQSNNLQYAIINIMNYFSKVFYV